MTTHTTMVLSEVESERRRQDEKWGEQNHGWVTGTQGQQRIADAARESCDRAFAAGKGGWQDILMEEFFEALAEADPDRLREELIQVAAVATAWIEAIDRRELVG